MNSQRTWRKVLAFFRRDMAIARSYRIAFALEILEAFFGVATFYYLSRFVSSDVLDHALPQGSDYFAFALVGFAFFDYLTVSMTAFDSSITEAQQNGTLEAMLVTETPLTMILIASTAYPFLLLAMRTMIYLAWGVLFFHFPVHQANWLGAAILLLVSILAFAGLGVISTSYLLLFKRGNPARWLIIGASSLLGGMMYPVSVLPVPLQWLARLLPVTYSLEGMRQALLGGASLAQLWPAVGALLLFAVILLPLSGMVFAWALRRTRITGTLTHL
ncbi:MAG: ABC transporter permease [Terriglobales bacterium]